MQRNLLMAERLQRFFCAYSVLPIRDPDKVLPVFRMLFGGNV
jgi:hypothetical protein